MTSLILFNSRKKLCEKAVTVAVTPNGYADAVYKNYFVMPEERQMKFPAFLHWCSLTQPQKPNQNLTSLPEDQKVLSWTTGTGAANVHLHGVDLKPADVQKQGWCRGVNSLNREKNMSMQNSCMKINLQLQVNMFSNHLDIPARCNRHQNSQEEIFWSKQSETWSGLA